MLRKLALSLAISAALGASQVNALGLGEIKVNSALNEPLDAEIKLTQVRDLSPLQIQPRMASLDEYATASASGQSRYLRDIQFQVLVSPEGNGRIRLKSTEPVQEPFLNFMVEVNWPSGRLVREYTLLLDPPVFEPTPVGQSFTTASVQPRPAVAVPPQNIRTRATNDGQMYVGVNDTLWEIAKNTKPQGTTEHQMMMAILSKNPQAFPSGNINNLKAGVAIDIPSAAEVQRLTHREAVAEVARQMQMWRDGKTTVQAQPKAPVDVSKPSATAEALVADAGSDDAPAEGQLTVVTPPVESIDPVEAAPAGDNIDADAAEMSRVDETNQQVVSAAAERLESEVIVAQEKIDRLERDNSDLNNKLDSVLQQLESQSRLLELQSQQMSTLQSELGQQSVAPVESADTVAQQPSMLQSPAVLGGLGAGVLALLGGVWFILRRKRNGETGGKRDLVSVPDDLRDDADVGDLAVGAAALAGAAVVADSLAQDKPAPLGEAEQGTDSDFVRPPMQSLAPEEEVTVEDDLTDLDGDLQDLDLDMDLDLDDLEMPNETVAASTIDAAEFDLGLEEEIEVAADDASATETDELEFKVEQPALAEAEEASELDGMLADDDLDDDLDFLLGDSVGDNDSVETSSLDEELDFGSLSELTLDEASEEESLENEQDRVDNSLHETVESAPELEFEVDPELEAMLQGGVGADEGTENEVEFGAGFSDDSDNADDDLDSLLASFDPEESVNTAPVSRFSAGEAVEEELTANISHDLEMDLDSEVEDLLNSTDDDIALEEQGSGEQEDVFDKLNLLSDADEIETKLDLARAYIEMDDGEGARDILNEITGEGSDSQRQEAQKLLETLG
ncbi:FimV-like protein [Marinobacterium halophilum]|uniref:FimV-like protein n=1 Tax=Marinobacterium halophilum TaxID=267374 RepID=A0A2P8EZK9_9GAMM|nr:FimV/HubP family polar landmark protein [Marinobacterium halophilum]PSL14899.1 FimV-like protein [Marinobacterium halophilum]